MPRMERPLLPALLWILLAASPACAEYFAILRANPPLVSDPKCKEISVSIAFGHPFAQTATDMDLVQMFAAVKYPAKKDGQTLRHEFLDTLKPIKYLKKNAWGGTIPLPDPGLYQLVLETRPYWEETQGIFLQQFAQTLVPVQGYEHGWEIPVGLKLEILPLTRPFGLTAPALFTGRVLFDDKILSDTPVRIEYLNEDKRAVPSPYHQTQRLLTNEHGVFSFVCPHSGWWGFAAVTKGDPLKGPDGQPKKTELSGVLWIYIDPPVSPKKKQTGQQDD
ncbi:MAG: DUF4198 domain-containing protein [Desulfovibrionaceae bacterium]|nr:DUF4198 domain-containing protein [Desulfovibrionaceae bacterium]